MVNFGNILEYEPTYQILIHFIVGQRLNLQKNQPIKKLVDTLRELKKLKKNSPVENLPRASRGS